MRIPPKCAWLLLLLAPGAGAAQDAAESPAAGEGAGFPRGHYAALDALPDWGGIWFSANAVVGRIPIGNIAGLAEIDAVTFISPQGR